MKEEVDIIRNDGSIILTIVRNDDDSVCLMNVSSPGMAKDVQRDIDRGLSQFVGKPGSRVPRKTLASDPLFIPRLREYIEAYGFKSVIKK